MKTAITDLLRALPAGDPRSQVFVEDRVDHRVVLRPACDRQVVASRTRGLAIGGRASIHQSDPDLPRPDRAETGAEAHENWFATLPELIAAAGAGSAAGRPQATWSAKLVAFHQTVWVGLRGHPIAQDSRCGCRVELRVQVVGDDPRSAVEELVLRGSGPWPIAEAFERAFDRAEARRASDPPPAPGVTTAVLAPGIAGVVAHELIGHALEGDVVVRGGSWIGDRDLPTAGRAVTVVDDPRLGRGAWSIDDEGVAARETILVERGRRVGLMIDRSTAEALSLRSTGHGRRSSYLETVRPRMGCTYIQSGSDDPGEVIRSTRAGLFIRRLATGHTDPSTGRATFLVSDADRIVDGRIAEPVDQFVLELEGAEAWSSIDRVADDLRFDTCIGSCTRDGQPLAVSVGAPTIRIGVVTVRS